MLLIPVNNTKICGNKLFRLILATEEVTGYYFRISKGQGEFYQRDGVLYLRVISPQACKFLLVILAMSIFYCLFAVLYCGRY